MNQERIINLRADGWLDGARHIKSKNYDERTKADDIVLLTVHGISLPRGQFGGDDIIKLLCGELDCDSHADYAALRGLRVSAHFIIRRDGELIQLVSCHCRAWHAGQSCWQNRNNVNDFSLGVELEGADDIPYTAAQYAVLGNLFVVLNNHYSLKIVGHQHIAPTRKTDPGPAFSWRQLFNLIGEQHDGRDADL